MIDCSRNVSMLAMNPIRIGQNVSQETRMESVELKETNRGPAVFTTLSKIINNELGECLREFRKLVYLESGPDLSSSKRVIKRNMQPDLSFSLTPSSICLFQYSALTFNSHKIHFDLDYATKVEGYRNVLVHG